MPTSPACSCSGRRSGSGDIRRTDRSRVGLHIVLCGRLERSAHLAKGVPVSDSAQHVDLPVPAVARRKLIEVSIPLQKINEESAREKSIRHGHPSTLHLWWARRPSQRPTAQPRRRSRIAPRPVPHHRGPGSLERKRLFELMLERLVVWENSNDEALLREARQKILDSTDGNRRPFSTLHAGGGTIPLEAQRLGLEVPRLRPQSGCGAHQQGTDRDPTEVPPVGAQCSLRRRTRPSGVVARHRPRRRRPPVRPVDARRGGRSASVTCTRRRYSRKAPGQR